MQLSKRLKTLALCWLRFEKQMPLVATEAGYWNADVMGIDPKNCIEIEVKVSKQDLNSDLTNKRNKHFMYKNPEQTKWTPNQFYFMVPKELEADAIKLCLEKAPQYGVIVARNIIKSRRVKGTKRISKKERSHGSRLYVAKRATKLHLNEPSPELKDKVLKRASSELCRAYLSYEELYDLTESQKKEDNDSKQSPKKD